MHDSPKDFETGIVDNTFDDPTYTLVIKVEDGKDAPYRESQKTTYSISTIENKDWDLDEIGEFNRVLINLSVFDEDAGEQIWWEEIKAPSIGELTLISGNTDNSPKTLIYHPDYLSYGDDNFTIAYTDDNVTYYEILFLVSIANDADPPKLGYKKDGINDVFFTNFLAEDPLVEDKFHFQIPVPENTPFTLSLPFSDSIDEQHIASVTKTGRDQDLFSITEPYQIEKYLDTNPYLWWVDLNWSSDSLPDFEDLPIDGSYYVSLIPRDAGDDTSLDEYTFEFVITNVDEAPIIYPRPQSIERPYEANETAIYGIHALDPESPESVGLTDYYWSISEDEKEFFLLRDSDNPERQGKVNC